MMRLFSILLFLLPASFCRFITKLFSCKKVQIGKGCYVGFSFVNCEEIVLADGSSIGHLNYIACKRLIIGGGKIKHFNLIKGPISVSLENGAWIHSLNKITCPLSDLYKPIALTMKSHAAIIQRHLFDLTDSITIGDYTTFAGCGSQIWTHAFIMGSSRHIRVDGEVAIGKKCYIGSRSVICAGVHICDNAVIGANTTVTKDITKPGLYVSSPMRYIEYNPDSAIERLKTKVAENVYSKTHSHTP